MTRHRPPSPIYALLLGASLVPLGCAGDDSGGSSATDSASTSATSSTSDTSDTSDTGSASESAAMGSESDAEGTSTGVVTSSESDTETSAPTTTGGCGVCDQPNQECVDDVCVTSCQGQDPDPCAPGQVCDVISGECKDPGASCSLAGGSEACDGTSCGPGSVCDGLGKCVPIAPCASVECTKEGECWGSLCSCTRAVKCEDPSVEQLNGPFSTDIGGLDFADDCTAWMVTYRSGTDYLRRLTPEGELTSWSGVSNLNMGEVRVLKRLTIPQALAPADDFAGETVDPPVPVEGFGEVAITYTCCPTCNCFVDPPQGVARLNEDDMDDPLPIIIVAKATQGMGPFGYPGANAGPQGLTWGEDRVLYVGNSTDNGDLNTANLDEMSQEELMSFDSRVTAGAPVSPAHILVAVIGGEVYRYNVNTGTSELVIDLMADITSLSHDSFTGLVYAGLSTLEIAELDPFTGEVSTFGQMPGEGRVAVSPSGNLWFTPLKIIQPSALTSWPLPDEV